MSRHIIENDFYYQAYMVIIYEGKQIGILKSINSYCIIVLGIAIHNTFMFSFRKCRINKEE